MAPVLQGSMIILIIGSAGCMLAGFIITAVRTVKFVRRERIMGIQNKIQAKRQIQEANLMRPDRYKDSR